MNEKSKKVIKATFVGDGGVGKTCLILSVEPHWKKLGPYNPVDDIVLDIPFDYDGIGYDLHLWDTAGTTERVFSYSVSNIVVICCDVMQKHTLDNIRDVWIPEVREHTSVPILICGNKTDLRDDEKTKNGNYSVINTEEGNQFARQNGSYYVECSSKLGLTKHVFNTILEMSLQGPKEQENSECVIL